MKFSLKTGVTLLTLNQLFDKYNIDEKYRNYDVLCENIEVNDTADLVANAEDINKLVVNHNKHFINIITKLYQKTLVNRKNEELDKKKNPQNYKSY